MKIKFKKQEFQTDAVKSIINVFKGQKYLRNNKGIADFIKEKNLLNHNYLDESIYDYDVSFSNPIITLKKEEILENIREIQKENGIQESSYLSQKLGVVDLDVEMETGTGKTYVYIKSIYELNKIYGLSKFIVIVPSVAIREGVKKSFEMTADHFMTEYGKKIRYYIYNSKRLNEIENFASSDSIQVMIINMQAFNSRSNDARKIYEKLDQFQSRRPIDVIAKTRPVLILDEPQKMGGEATQQSLKNFKPLFSINFSATHREKHNLIYVLDAVDAYNKKIVKKIEVKGFSVKNLRGLNGFLYLENIIISSNKPPQAKLFFEIDYITKSINRESRLLKEGDNLFEKSNKMEQYKNGYLITNIDPINDTITFLNGLQLKIGEAVGDLQDNDLRRIQIRETIKSHIEKEITHFKHGIKVLSLFFIDEVSKYRQYDKSDKEINGLYGDIFEQEYNNIVAEYFDNEKIDDEYMKYLQTIDSSNTHKGYFSIDKKNRMVDSKIKRGSDISDDESAYELILRNKEKLLSFEEPTRFIFSHSALREGWDNPNIFQICTLRNTKSSIQKHQEVGRGLRLCVNQQGERIDSDIFDLSIHDINKLTVIANESYEDFVNGLQNEISETLYNRELYLTPEYFTNKKISDNFGNEVRINSKQGLELYKYLFKNDYISDDNLLKDKFIEEYSSKSLAKIHGELEKYSDSIHQLIIRTNNNFDAKKMFKDGNKSRIVENKINDNFYKKEFQNLWSLINKKYIYKVDFDSNELINKSIKSINNNLSITNIMYTVTTSEQKEELDRVDIETSSSFEKSKTRTEIIRASSNESTIKYDLIGKISENTNLKRSSVFKIISKISEDKKKSFQENPEEFISKISILINAEKAALTVEHIKYDTIEGTYDSNIFFENKKRVDFLNAFKANKHIRDYVFTDGFSGRSKERIFAEDLDSSDDVCVYAKLPKSFYIPTPVGNYSPDWAITFHDKGIKHIYFIAETKGTMDTLQLSKIEEIKIECAKKLFESLSEKRLKYAMVDSYMTMLSILK
ncbi:MAG: DEAD/DEAH box helicase family protein [Acholeplasmataceae bacterium]